MSGETPTEEETVWYAIMRLLRWDKPAGRLILMIPALWAVVLAGQGRPPWLLVLVIMLGSIATSGAGCVINDLWDRNIDPLVERTKVRPLASRALSVRVGIAVFLTMLFCAAGLAVFLKPLSFLLCILAVPVIVAYPLAKRVFPLPQLVLSFAWGFAVLISWSAVTGDLDRAAWSLWGATVLWTLGFDTVYALADREDDRQIGIHSSALFFGRYAPEAIAVCYTATAILLIYVGYLLRLHPTSYGLSCGVAIAGWVWQYQRLKQTHLPRHHYGQMFGENVWIGAILLVGMIAGAWLS